MAQPTKSLGAAAVVSFLFTGLGQIYNEKFGKAALLFIGGVVLWAMGTSGAVFLSRMMGLDFVPCSKRQDLTPLPLRRTTPIGVPPAPFPQRYVAGRWCLC